MAKKLSGEAHDLVKSVLIVIIRDIISAVTCIMVGTQVWMIILIGGEFVEKVRADRGIRK